MNELEKEIRKYKLDDLLLLLSDISKKMYRDRTPITQILLRIKRGSISCVATQAFAAWSLADMAYAAIKVSNDFRSKKPTEEDIYKLNNLNAIVSDEEAKAATSESPKEDVLLQFGFGYTQKQLWYQEIIKGKKVYYNFLRYYILLSEIPPYFSGYKLPSDDLKELTSFDIKSFSQLLACAWALNYTDSPLVSTRVSEDLTEKIPISTETNLKKCLSFFTADYDYYRKGDFPNNPLFLKPIIKTETGKLIISNAFIWSRKLYEGIYWLIRDKYMEEGSCTFINNFGEYYERYVQEILGYYLAEDSFEKIERSDCDKRADWLIHTERYVLVVEQKSSLMSIALKKEYPSIPDIAKYLEKFKEAFLQIYGSVKSLKTIEKQIIKLVLHFESLYMKDRLLKGKVVSACKDEMEDFSHYFFIDTEEFERLIQMLAYNEETFNEVIQAKIAYEREPATTNRADFDSILHRYDDSPDIKFLESRKHYFEDLFGD